MLEFARDGHFLPPQVAPDMAIEVVARGERDGGRNGARAVARVLFAVTDRCIRHALATPAPRAAAFTENMLNLA